MPLFAAFGHGAGKVNFVEQGAIEADYMLDP
jgi:hypothetical protein